ncbi:autotransporter-associated beta strand repeat-containing protein [Luteolibacter marinus]|uniref:autotransporter-associated beta strand repeat-containing protein n=1 Tax=Luteolibacter marinus TaxID=2776705 RepID=UPI0018667597|nr:autotransporter-associated beta strand repeat-containing protein [Luteolibacter marinus]
MKYPITIPANVRWMVHGTVACMAVSLAHAEEEPVTWTGGGANLIWSTAENWSDSSTPGTGFDYLVDAATVRSPDVTSTTFGGNSLTVQNGSVLHLMRTNGGGYYVVNHAIPALTLSSSEIRTQSSLGSLGNAINGPVQFLGDSTVNMKEKSDYTMRLFFNGTISGSGSLTLSRDDTGSTRSVEFAGDATGYAGDVLLSGYASNKTMEFDVNNAGGWGSGSVTVGAFGKVTFKQAVTTGAGQLVLDGATASVVLPATPVSLGSIVQNDGTINLDITRPDPLLDPVADRVDLSGDFTANGGALSVDLKVAPLTDVPYTLVSYAGTLVNQPVVNVIDTANTAYQVAVDYGTGSNSAITVTFSEFAGEPANLVWSGSVDESWDIGVTANWLSGGLPATYTEFDHVLFDDSAPGTEPQVYLDTDATPTSVTFNHDTDTYYFGGSGGIAGPALLTKYGAGTLVIGNNNSHIGGTDILEGTLQVGDGFTTGSIGSGTVVNEAELVFNRTDTFVFAPAVSGTGNLEQVGGGKLVLAASHNYTGTTTVTNGTLQVGDGSTNTPDQISYSSEVLVGGSGVLELPRFHTGGNQNVAWTLPPVSLADGATLRFTAQAGSNTHTLSSDLAVDGYVYLENLLGSYSQNINLTGELSGSGEISYISTAGTSNRQLALTLADSPYSGDWFVRHDSQQHGVLRSSAAGSLGTGAVWLSRRAILATGVSGGLDSLSEVILDDPDASLVTTADTTVAGIDGSAGKIEVQGGILTLAGSGIPDAADVEISSSVGAVLNLDFTGTDEVRDLKLDGVVQATGTWGSLSSAAENKTAAITGTGVLVVLGSDPFPAWVDAYFPGESDPAVVGKDADPDQDGWSNELEFALNSDPSSGRASDKVAGVVADVGGHQVLTYTIPVRDGAVFAGATEKTAEVDGLLYRIQGSSDLSDWTSSVITEITPSLSAGLPVPDEGWSYRTFRMAGDTSTGVPAFIRATVEGL